MNPSPEFYERLKLQRGALLWLLLLVLGFSFLGAFSLAILIANALNSIEPWQEASAFQLVLVLTLVGGVGYLIALVVAFMRRPGLIYLARIIEERHPELRESLSTATEIQANGGPKNDLEAALFRSVEAQSEEINFRTATLPKRLHPLMLIGLVFVSFFMSNWARESAVMLKAQYHLADLRMGKSTGLLVEPGSADAPRGSDLDVEVVITRWRAEAMIDYRNAEGVVESYPMVHSGEVFDFTWYALEESFDYRVRTPSLQSEWFTVTVFEPPIIDEVEINLTPPSYTGEEPLAFSQLMDLFTVEGSAVTFQLVTAPTVQTWLRLGDEETAFEGEIAFTAEATTEYQFRLRNAEGREAITEEYLLEVKPDEPPTVAILDPAKDTQALLDEIVPLEIYAADDYGLSRIEVEISVSGLPRSPIVAFKANDHFPPEENVLPVIELSRLGVEFGDVVTYFAKAWDNREPEPQVSRSEIYFIEIVENIDKPDQDDEAAGGGGDGGKREEDVDLRAIITELKRLIRLAYRADFETGERRSLGSQELGAGLAEVATESQGILAKVGGVLGRIEEGMPYEMFLDAIYRMVDAEELANAGQPGEAIIPMQESMSLLIRLEKYLEALFPPQQQSGGQGQGQPSKGEGGGESKENEDGDSGMSIAEMQKALEEMNRMADEQAAMNRRFERASSKMGESERAELEKMQQDLGKEVQGLTSELGKLRQGTNVRDAMRSVDDQMSQAAGAAGEGDSNRAGRAGARARQGLMDAAGLLDERIRSEATAAIASLAQQAEKLSQGQGAAAADSRGAAASEVDEAGKDALKNQQAALNEDWGKLRQDMERLTGDLSGVFPEAAEALSEVATNAREQNIDREMSRAANALLYGRYSRAGSSQEQAAEGLGNLANQLDEAAGTLPGLSPTELRQLIDRVAEARRELGKGGEQLGEGEGEAGEAGKSGQSEGQGEGESAQAAKDGGPGAGKSPGQGQGEGQGEGQQGQGQSPGEGQGQGEGSQASQLGGLGDSISQAGRALKDDSLVRLGSELKATKGGEGAGGHSPASVLDSTARVLQEYLRQEIGDQRLRFNREGGPPPEKYRELVEEYFRDLAEEPSK
ncbi:hypothetical protein GCM10007047_11830 [Cerasicoccus arenae]|uniref:DUF4175 domain-containing protein n=1 Tax=Cerasicoccus arenae TaxID=424488 RepID=A0A8J3GDP2_9BACT|nr:hypothetical protein GCM10007047_11830 [Cerasicoccus arenae]